MVSRTVVKPLRRASVCVFGPAALVPPRNEITPQQPSSHGGRIKAHLFEIAFSVIRSRLFYSFISMVKFVLRKSRAVFPSLAAIITTITIMALKSNHLKRSCRQCQSKRENLDGRRTLFFLIYGMQLSKDFIIMAVVDESQKGFCAYKNQIKKTFFLMLV